LSEIFDQQELMASFLAECEECLASLDENLVSLEAAPDSADTIDTIFRMAHTLKGTSASVGFSSLARLGHSMENVLDRIRDGSLSASSTVISLLLQSGDAFRKMLPRVVAGSDVIPEQAADVISALDAVGGAAPAGSVSVDQNGPRATEGDGSTAVEEGAKTRRVRVGLDKLDGLLDLTGEIVISLVRLRSEAEKLKGSGPTLESLTETERLMNDFQERVMGVRMLPVGVVFEPHRRTVRDLARSTGKQVRLVIEGADVEIDASVIEHVKDPLMHLVRNAVDHGIELPGERRQSGKPEEGTVTLRASRQSGCIVIEVGDDGAGLDRERILARALQRGLVEPNLEWSDAEVHRLIFRPGFSTNDTVSDTSGRGVGLDVVARNVSALRGHIEIEDQPKRGTTFTMRLPLTLAILPGLAVESGGERFVIPLDTIEECLESSSLENPETTGLLDVRGEPVPYLRLAGYYALRDVAATHESAVVVRAGRNRIALLVDSLLGEMQTVIKPVGALLQHVPGIGGSTLFGDGRIGLILDVPTLLRQTQTLSRKRPGFASAS
jgi:two-component system chemotaxis sensor kinase CheA